MPTLKVKPVEGKKIPNPETGRKLLKDVFTVVPRTNYWLRRVEQKDVVVEGQSQGKQETKKVEEKSGDKK